VRRFEARVALVTGGASGLGLAVARHLVAEEAKVILVDWDGAALESAERSLGGEVRTLRGDVSTEETAAAAVDLARSAFGRLDVLFNNAGIDPLRARSVLETEVEDWDRVLDVNVRSAYLMSRAAIPLMRVNGGGAIVNTASVAGLAGTNFHAYSASKGGMIALSRSIATTYAPQNIRSNVICPGFIETPMTAEISGSQRLLQAYLESTPLHKAGKPLDIAYMALYLASDEAAFVTGGVFVVDGGVMAR
jgi:NAD(P)-dependent dehydrogenase (short-subunit alcohol dehydrogenase family)